ncbi:MAG: ComEC/Rec2 family competence protein [Clostridia bacterium]|nr:ComEC/Rec2 family competence protein [Clostridia bacterium]
MRRPAAIFGFAFFLTLLWLCGRDIVQIKTAMAISVAVFVIAALLHVLTKRRFAALLICITVSVSALIAETAYFAKYVYAYAPAAALVTEDTARITGVVSDAAQNGGRYNYTVQLEDVNGYAANAGLLASAYTDLYLQAGDRIEFSAAGIYTLGDDDYKSYYMSQGTYIGAQVQKLTAVQENVAKNIVIRIARLRGRLCQRLLMYTGSKNGGLLCGIIFGDTAYLSGKIQNSFRLAGISHVFAVSGLHVSAWSMLVYYLLKRLRCGKRATAIVSSLFVLLVCAITGFPLSALRAAVMLIIVFAAGAYRLESDMLNSLGIALTAICAADPFSGGSRSLLLSAAATVGIVVFADYIFPDVESGMYRLCGRRLSATAAVYVLSVLLLSITVTIVMLPLLIYCFGNVSVLTPLSNLAVLPFAELAMLAGGVSVLVNFPVGIRMAGRLSEFALTLTDAMASVPLAGIRPSLRPVLLTYGAALLLFFIFKFILRKKPIRGAFFFAAFLVTLTVSVAVGLRDYGRVKITAVPSVNVELIVQYRDFDLLICGGSPSHAAVNALTDAGVYDLDMLYLDRQKSTAVLRDTFAPQIVAYRATGGTVTADAALTVTFSPDGVCRIVCGDTCVGIVFDGAADTVPDADYLYVKSLPADYDPSDNRIWWVAGRGENTEQIFYTYNGITLEF